MWNRLCLTLVAILLPLSALAAEEETDYSKIRLDVENFNPANVCGECHIDIYAYWNQSMHSKAMTDPAFLATFREPRIQGDAKVRETCLRCHAPTQHYKDTLSVDSDIAQEGITCDFCHSIQEVRLENRDAPFVVQWGKLKRGPLKDTQSPVHETRPSELFESGDLCGGCHEMVNAKGLPIISTYSEWKEAFAPNHAGTDCQDCHMPKAAGFTVSQKLKKTKRRINLHSFPGGHSRAQLLDAVAIELLEERKMYGKMKVKLGLTNVGAGHYVPTGNPLRKIVIDFSAYRATNALIYNEQVELSRIFVDKQRRELHTDLEILLDAVKVIKDNRIAPGETKELIFEFLAPDEKILIDAKVVYVYENQGFPDMSREEKLISFTRVVNRAAGEGGPSERKISISPEQ